MKYAFNLKCRRAAGELTLFAAFLDGNTRDAVGLDECFYLGGKGFDVGRFIVIVEGDFLGGQGDVGQRLVVQRGNGDDGFAAFDFDAAESHE